MTEIEADIALGEAGLVVLPAQDAVAGVNRSFVIEQGVGLGVGMGAVAMVGALLAVAAAVVFPSRAAALVESYWSLEPALTLVGAVLGLKIGEAIGARRHYRGFMRGLRTRGTPERLRTRYRLTDEALCIDTDRLSYVARWPSILEVFRGPTHWLLQSDTITFILPKAAFPSPEEEQRFIAELADRLTPEARERSRAAMAAG